MQKGSMIEQNYVETTKVAVSKSGLSSAGISVAWLLSAMMTVGFTPRERAMPQMA